MTHPLILEVRAALKKAADPVKAPKMQAYMKSTMPYRGVSSPEQKAIWKAVFLAHPLSSSREWQKVALTLWREATFREERYGAIALTGLRQYALHRTMDSIPMFEEMIVTGAWWDFVDTLAGHNLGDILRAHPRKMKPLMRRWARDADMWKRRTAITRDGVRRAIVCTSPEATSSGRSRRVWVTLRRSAAPRGSSPAPTCARGRRLTDTTWAPTDDSCWS